jgi:thymidylate synthase
MSNLDKQYIDLLQDILDNGVKKQTRNGEVLSVFGKQIRHKMSEGFPLLTTKKMTWKQIVTELLWFLRGDTNIKYLVDNGCHIWDGDAYKNYLKWAGNNPLTIKDFIERIKTDSDFAGVYGELGPVYGKQWRSWEYQYGDEYSGGHHLPTLKKQIDQIAKLIYDLKTNPDSRRLLVSAWNPADLDSCVLPPCHYGFQVYTRELNREERVDLYIKKYGDTGMDYQKYKDTIPTRAISLMWNQRSVDFGLGAPFNIASYGLLLEIIAKEVNMIPDELIGNLGDVHLYLDHVEPIKEQLNRDPFILPKLKIKDKQINDISQYNVSDFELIGYQSHPTIKLPLSN